MPTYTHEDVIVRFPDALTGMSVSGLLTNKATFHVKVYPPIHLELFALISPDYNIQIVVHNEVVEFRRNQFVARKEIGKVNRHFQVLASWQPNQFQLAIMVDDNVGGEDACVTVKTEPLYVPISLLKWARKFNLIPRTTYNSAAEFFGVFIESLRQAEKVIHDTNSYSLFWDRQHSKRAIRRMVPKREPVAMSGVAAFIQDQSIIAGYQIIKESGAGSGSLDLRAIATLTTGEIITVCVEGKNAQSTDIEHGITDQLPEYMRRTGASYGIYLVLWYKCELYPKPNESGLELTLRLTKLRPWETIVVEQFDLAIPLSPSHRDFEYE